MNEGRDNCIDCPSLIIPNSRKEFLFIMKRKYIKPRSKAVSVKPTRMFAGSIEASSLSFDESETAADGEVME